MHHLRIREQRIILQEDSVNLIIYRRILEMRNRFDEQLADLNKKLIEMGAICEECISLAAKALKIGRASCRERV